MGLGLADGVKGYRVMTLENGRLFLRRSVVFDEMTFPLKSKDVPELPFKYVEQKDPEPIEIDSVETDSEDEIVEVGGEP